MNKYLFISIMLISLFSGQCVHGGMNVGKMAVRAKGVVGKAKNVSRVRRITLTPEEKAILPVNGIATHRIRYSPKEARVYSLFERTSKKIHNLDTQVSELMSQTLTWRLRRYTTFLDHDLFPRYAQLNEQIVRDAQQFSMNNLKRWIPHEIEFLKYLQVETYRSIPWEKYLPSQPVDFIVIGETHNHMGTYRTILQAVKALKEKNPNRKIIFATEYVSDTLMKGSFPEKSEPLFVRNSTELENALVVDKNEMALQFLTEIFDMDVEIVGIEPRSAVINAFLKERGLTEMSKAEKDNHYAFARSEVMIKERNQKWAEYLNQLRAQNPDALIIGHCGSSHSNLNTLYSFPSLLKGNKFVIQFTPQQELSNISPAFYLEVVSMNLPQESFSLGDKQVFSFKPSMYSLPLATQQLFRTAWGADLVISLTR